MLSESSQIKASGALGGTGTQENISQYTSYMNGLPPTVRQQH